MNKKVMKIITILLTIITVVLIASTCFADEIDVKSINGKLYKY